MTMNDQTKKVVIVVMIALAIAAIIASGIVIGNSQ